MAGKGSRPRPVDRKKYAENYDAIFGKRCRFPNGQCPAENQSECTTCCQQTKEDKNDV